ncbi:hypothetical protein L0F63_007213, partial [Massospora cicadina]
DGKIIANGSSGGGGAMKTSAGRAVSGQDHSAALNCTSLSHFLDDGLPGWDGKTIANGSLGGAQHSHMLG